MATIILTGANGNLGLTVTNHLLSKGYRVVAVTGPGGAGNLPSHIDLVQYEVDLKDEQATRDFILGITQEFSDIQAAVMLVGGFAMGKLQETTNQLLRDMIELNFYSAYHIVRPLFTCFEKTPDGGQFILIGSRPGLNAADGTNYFAYSFSKSMVAKLAEFINEEGKDKNIKATLIVPATIDTPANRQAMPEADFSRWVPPGAIAETISFCLSETGCMLRQNIIKIYNRS
jgi:NAD(P)-dependent dehydrogenase (short-subunit alcohol dehydrogenase family)